MVAGQPQLIKEVNIDLVKRIIFEKGPMSKPMMAKESNLSLPTVNKIADLLEKDGIIKQCGINSGKVGRRAKIYKINKNFGNIIILNFVEDSFICALVDLVGNIISKKEFPILDNDPLEVVYSAISHMKESSNTIIKAIGLSVPGVVSSDNVISGIPNIPSWQRINIKELIESKYNISTFVENDVKLASYGYFYTHLKDEYSDIVYLYIGKGLGSGIIINKKIYKGYSSSAGEIGYLPPFVCTACSTIKNSRNAFEKQIQEAIHFIESTSGHEKENYIKQYINLISLAITTYVCILNPEVIVIQGKYIHEKDCMNLSEMVRNRIEDIPVPKIIIDNKNNYSLSGTINMCITNMTSSLKLVEEKGI